MACFKYINYAALYVTIRPSIETVVNKEWWAHRRTRRPYILKAPSHAAFRRGHINAKYEDKILRWCFMAKHKAIRP